MNSLAGKHVSGLLAVSRIALTTLTDNPGTCCDLARGKSVSFLQWRLTALQRTGVEFASIACGACAG